MNRKREQLQTKKKLSATVGHDHVKRSKKKSIFLQYHFHYAAL